MNKRFALMLVITIVLSFLTFFTGTFLQNRYDIVIYGGSFPGCAAAYQAAQLAPDKKVLLIVTEPVHELGGLGTVGGQNFADIRFWRNEIVTAGSFARWYNSLGQFYNTEKMAALLESELERFPNITILYSYELQDIAVRKERISSLELRAVKRDENGFITSGSETKTVSGEVFIDASTEGKLTLLTQTPLISGRNDWPAAYLPENERNQEARQQAATLMFKVKNVQVPAKPMHVGQWHFVQDHYGSWGIVGGKETWQNNPVVRNFNEKYQQQGFSLKPLNVAQDGAGSDEWWVNMLLIYGVDGRFTQANCQTPACSTGQKTTDQAWIEAKKVLMEPDFLAALRCFHVQVEDQTYGFKDANLVLENGQPVVGEILYIRETIHSSLKETTKEQDFALCALDCQLAGASKIEGNDAEHYQQRIGLAYYMMDINAYLPEDLQENGLYKWPVTAKLRPDLLQTGGQPKNPVYLPYRMLTVSKIKNLLVPGYATGCSSLAWAEIRVLPNLTVLGDAAGVAAARAVLYQEEPRDFTIDALNWIQEKLQELGARIDK